MDGALRIIDRGAILDAARHAFDLYQWLTAPDFDQEGEVQRAEKHLAGFGGDPPCLRRRAACTPGSVATATASPGAHPLADPRRAGPLLDAAPPAPDASAADRRRVAETPWEPQAWVPAFLRALAAEAADGRQLLMDLERAWFAARAAVAGRRRDSHVAAAVDVLAAAPLVSATSLAAGLGLAVKNAIRLLDGLVVAGIVVEVTHRSKRRLFGLNGLAALGEAVRPPYRPEPGRGRGRPPILTVEDDVVGPPPPLPPLTPIERRVFDYSDLVNCMAHMDQAIRHTRRVLTELMKPMLNEPATHQSVDGERAQPSCADMEATP